MNAQGTYRIISDHIGQPGSAAEFTVDWGGEVVVMAKPSQVQCARDAGATHVTLDAGGNVTGWERK
jgi:hypothetical protein